MATEELESILDGLGGERRINYTLDRFREALAAVGNPEKYVQSLVIAGTNGKGGTALFVSSALTHAGFRTGTYLSPHLQHPRERMLCNLLPIEEGQLLGLAKEFLTTARKFELTYFEYMTLLMLLWAKREEMDFVVLEVGLGGRLDATNVTHPIAVAVTNIAFDHQNYLGDTLEKILHEKLGVLREESLLFTGVRDPALLAAVEKRCAELDAIYYYSKELKVERRQVSWSGQTILINGTPFQLTNPSSGTIDNAALAFLMMRITFPKIPMTTLQTAFRAVRNPGRMEVIQEKPRVVLSGDHNPAGIECLKTTLKELNVSRLRTVCAFSADKPYEGMYGELKGLSDDIILTSHSRNRDLSDDYRKLGCLEPNPEAAVRQALQGAKADDTILVTGSLYLVGEVRKLWRSKVEFLDTPGRGWERPFPGPGAATPTKPPAKGEEQNPAP